MPMSGLRPVTVITGASAGIGAALAHVFARNGHELALVARREDRLRALADEIAATGRAKPLVIVADLQLPGATLLIGDALAAHGVEPQFVVNNAGFGLVGTAASLDREEELAMIDVNMRALTELSLAFVESLARHRGGILNLASVAAFLPGPGMAVYYASKAFVLSFTEALHHELSKRGIRVTALCPGPVPTEFQARAGIKTIFGPKVLIRSADAVAAAGYAALMRGQRVVVPGITNTMVTMLVPLLPRGLLLEATARSQLGRAKPSKRSLAFPAPPHPPPPSPLLTPAGQ